jgi:hypothetical protein
MSALAAGTVKVSMGVRSGVATPFRSTDDGHGTGMLAGGPQSLDVGIDHHPDETGEIYGGFPAQHAPGFRRVAHEQVHFRRAENAISTSCCTEWLTPMATT